MKVYKVAGLDYANDHSVISTICPIGTSSGEHVTLGHSATMSSFSNLQTYKVVEEVGNEIHIHTIVTLAGAQFLLGTKMISSNFIHRVAYTKPTMALIHLLSHEANIAGFTVQPMQSLMIDKLLFDLRYHFADHVDHYNTVIELLHLYKLNDPPNLLPNFVDAYMQISERWSYYEEVTEALERGDVQDALLYIRYGIMHMEDIELQQSVGLAASMLAIGEIPQLNLNNSIDCGGVFFNDAADRIIVNPHLSDTNICPEVLDLIDICENCIFAEFELEFSTTLDNVRVILAKDHYLRDVTPHGFTIPHPGKYMDDMGIELAAIAGSILTLINGLSDMDQHEITSISIAKFFSGRVVLMFSTADHGNISYIIDGIVSQILTPAITVSPKAAYSFDPHECCEPSRVSGKYASDPSRISVLLK